MTDSTYKAFARTVLGDLFKVYFGPLYRRVQAQSSLDHFTGFLLCPEKIVLHMGRTHLGIEYYGPERIESLPRGERPVQTQVLDYSLSSDDFVERVIGFGFGKGLRLPISGLMEDLFYPTAAGMEKLTALRWNFGAQDMILTFGARGAPALLEGQFSRWVNCYFFDADESGLRTRHIKWIDFVPLKYDDSGMHEDSFEIDLTMYKKLRVTDADYKYPLPPQEDFKYKKLPIINRFIELTGTKNSSETDITAFLSKKDHQFIITMKFGAARVAHELTCKWQSVDRPDLRPDFFLVQPDGYADILEFKLPDLKNRAVTGPRNRETFSAELARYISQTRVYQEYFDDPKNREWFEQKYGFKVHRPRRILIAGRRSDFTADIWRDIVDDYKNIAIITYDDLVDGVVAQFYK